MILMKITLHKKANLNKILNKKYLEITMIMMKSMKKKI